MSIYIGKPVEYSDMQGPCTEGFHIPTNTEWAAVKTVWTTLGGGSSDGTNFGIALKLPFAGYRSNLNSNIDLQGSYGFYSTSINYGGNNSYNLNFGSSYILEVSSYTTNGYSIRGFKNTPVTPTNSWTKLYGTSIEAGGIFWSSTAGLISLSSDGSTRITIADKNVGATTVWNSGDTLSESNCGYYYQRGNNYGFPFTGSVTTSSTQVNANTYGPGNYYSSSTFITGNNNWDSSNNSNLRGGVSQGTSTKSTEVKNIYIGEYKPIYKGEYIEYKMNADSYGYLYVPVSGYSFSGYQNVPYSWKVSIDGGADTTYSGNGGSGRSFAIGGYTAGTSHTIKITPTTEAYGWARAYGWESTEGRSYITEIVYDSSYMGYASSATDTGIYFRNTIYYNCYNLTNTANEYMPDTVTTIGNYFRYGEYNGCTSLTYSPEEVLPDSVTTIGSNFRGFQYYQGTSLTEVKGWKDLSIGNSSYYRYQQYQGATSNKTVKVLSDVGYGSSSDSTLPYSYVSSVYVPSQYLNNFKDTNYYPRGAIDDSKFIGY